MRITRNQLQGLINEEISQALLKTENRRLVEVAGDGGLYDLDASELLDFAASYARLGAAVQEQLQDLLSEQEDASVNPNAVTLIRRELGGMNAEIDQAIEAWTAAQGED